MRVAVVTPYHLESGEILRLCHDSVRTQSHPCTHFLVADGKPRGEVSTWQAQQLILGQAHGDNGNTPRAVGSLSAMNQGFDAIAFLDADNWYYPNHLETMIHRHQETGAVVCTATRSIHRQDGSLLYIDAYESDGERHVDTSCLFLTRNAFVLLPIWAMMPRELGPICDTIFWQSVRARGLKTAHSGRPTVAFRTQYAVHYRSQGEEPPVGSKSNEESTGRAFAWWRSLSESDRMAWKRTLELPAGWMPQQGDDDA